MSLLDKIWRSLWQCVWVWERRWVIDAVCVCVWMWMYRDMSECEWDCECESFVIVCRWVWEQMRVWLCVDLCMCEGVWLSMNVNVGEYVRLCTFVQVCLCVCVCVSVCVCLCVCRREGYEEKIMVSELVSQKKRGGFGFNSASPNPQSGCRPLLLPHLY